VLWTLGRTERGHHPSDLGGRPAYAHGVTGRLQVTRLATAVEHISAPGADDRTMRAQILDVIRGFVAFDSYAFVLTDPVTAVGCSPLAEVPNLAILPDLIRLKYLTPVNRWTTLPMSGCASLQQATGGRPEQSLLWRERLAGLGIQDVISVVFADRYGCWGFLDLWRRQRPFDDDEVAALSAARPAVTSRLRDAQAAGFNVTGIVTGHRGPGALVLSPTLTVRAQTPQTQEWLAALVPPESGHGPVPASAYNVAAQRAARVAGTEPVEDRDIVVTMEASSPSERRDLFSRCHQLTGREGELLRHLGEGMDTRTVSTRMSISEHTIQDHLKSMFAKTATSSRRELLAKSVGQ
jgi:DNA-binding CsgD family transcriptional regulator